MIHLAHFLDGYPLCWPQTQEGEFEATAEEDDVTCNDCRRYLDDPDNE